MSARHPFGVVLAVVARALRWDAMKPVHSSWAAIVAGSVLALSALAPAYGSTDPVSSGDVVEPAPEVEERVAGTTAPEDFAPSASVENGGLQLMHAFTGNLNWSVDGLGSNSGSTGTLQVEKPAGATVLRAFLVLASFDNVATAGLSDVVLNGATPTFGDDATDTTYGFRNFLADVTDIVAPTIDAAGAGTVAISMDEGASASSIEGSALVVVFEDPAVSVSSIALYFGTSQTSGDEFTLQFDALTEPQTQDLRMSIGSAYSYGSGQTSTISVNGTTLSDQAGHFDDCDEFVAGDENSSNWTCGDGALITVGGVGDSLANPTVGDPWSTVSDDELYSLSPFVSVGDTEIQVQTLNASGDDNIFMAVFFLDEVELEGATPIGDGVGGEEELADTGAADVAGLIGIALVALIVGALAVGAARRHRARAAA